jgi:hypothetical protein
MKKKKNKFIIEINQDPGRSSTIIAQYTKEAHITFQGAP